MPHVVAHGKPALVWEREIQPLLPPDYRDQARRLGAWTRTRAVPSIDALFQALLCDVLCVRSLRQLGAWATVHGLGSISDRAWSQRVRHSTAWMLWLLGDLVLGGHPPLAAEPRSARVRIIDASMIRMRSQHGHSARLHCSYDVQAGRLDQIHVTDEHQAEGIHHFTLQAQDIFIADRIYCRRATLTAVCAATAHLVVRWHSTNLPLTSPTGVSFDVLAWLDTVVGDEAEQAVWVGQQPVRLLARRLSPAAAAREAYRRRRKAVKVGVTVRPRTLAIAPWLLVITTLPETWSCSEVLALYRLRWNIEVLFKRLKQLVGLHGLPSFLYQTILAVALIGWELVARQQRQVQARWPHASVWQGTEWFLQTFRTMVWGAWTWATLVPHLEALRRYLRPGRPPRPGSDWLICHLRACLPPT
jgi:hypothetical protein